MKYKLKDRTQYKKIQNLFDTRLVFYDSNSKTIEVEATEAECPIIEARIHNLINQKSKEDLRYNVILILKSKSIGTPIEPYVLALIKHYKDEIDLFIKDGLEDFKDNVTNESEEPFSSYLKIVIEAPTTEYPTGKTVRDSILEHII